MLTKQEIYVKLGYRGEYTKEVKRRFRLLCKRYHPDVNQGDDRTMKLLNQVKEEIEQATINHDKKTRNVYPSRQNESDSSEPTSFRDLERENVFRLVPKEVLEQKIKQLEEKLKAIAEELANKNKKIHEMYQRYNELLGLIEKDKTDIEYLKQVSTKYNNQLFLFLGILAGLFFTILFFGIILGILYGHYQNIYFWLVLIAFSVAEIVSFHFLIRVFDKRRLVDIKISTYYAVKNERILESFRLQDRIMDTEEEYRTLKENRNKYAGDRQLYYYEISKKQERVVQRTKIKKYSSRR